MMPPPLAGTTDAAHEHRSKRRWFVVGLIALAVVLVLGGLRIFDAVAHTCNDQERAAFLEFPQYGGRVIQPGNDVEARGCVASFQTADPHEDVIRYYERQLGQQGWTTQDFEDEVEEGGAEPAGGGSPPASAALSAVPSCARSSSMCSGTLAATRGGFSYSIDFEAAGGSTSVVVRVNEASGP
jgi:hypothetical protein